MRVKINVKEEGWTKNNQNFSVASNIIHTWQNYYRSQKSE